MMLTRLAKNRITGSKLISQLCVLTKFKLSSLNTFVAASAFMLAQGPFGTLPLLVASTQCFAMSSQVFNQIIQRNQDKLMQRTHLRPLVTGSISLPSAKIIGSLLLISGSIISLLINKATFFISLGTCLSYLAVYTPLKTRSQTNTIIGALIGSATVYIGWAASNQSLCMCEPLALFSYMVAWQLQHFYAIRWMYFNDYQKVFKMQSNRSLALFQTCYTMVLSTLIFNYSFLNCSYNPYCVLNVIFSASLFLFGFKSIMSFQEDGKARQMKIHSYSHFTVIFLIISFLITIRWFQNQKIAARSMPPKNQATANQSGLLTI